MRNSEPTRNRSLNTTSTGCPCGNLADYATCCQPLHDNNVTAKTAEQLMRARYSAFSLKKLGYLLSTWHETTRPGRFEFEVGLVWTGLTIKSTQKGREKDNKGWVQFSASYQILMEIGELKEKSYFKRGKCGNWFYVEGEILAP
ncbi:MAG: hypothetical protein GXO35_05760 [Gammaproteobacteria bacterium]|nr:hypothetical protein [Gammaproteobacteria bacterium]